MGGKLFGEHRMSRDEYLTLQGEVIAGLSHFLGKPALIPDTFKNKDSFGDLDVLTTFPLVTDEELKDVFCIGNKDIHHNTSVISINLAGRQVDICHFDEVDLDSAFAYYRQGDTGNLIGKIARWLGFRFTHKGLVLPIKLKQEDCLGDVLISKDVKGILEFLDLVYDRWEKGFNEPLELYEWIMESKYFNPNAFWFENIGHEDKTRNRKRVVYAGFIEHLEKLGTKLVERDYILDSPANHIWRAALHFSGNFLSQANFLIDERRKVMQSAAVFSGHDIMQITSLRGGELGEALKGFKQHWDNGVGRWNGSTKEEMSKHFLNYYESQKKKTNNMFVKLR